MMMKMKTKKNRRRKAMITKDQEKILRKNLSNCNNVKEAFTYIDNTFDLKGCEPGDLLKPKFIDALIKALKALNPDFK